MPSAAWEPGSRGAGGPGGRDPANNQGSFREAAGRCPRRQGAGGSARPAWRTGTACTCACGDPSAGQCLAKRVSGPFRLNIYPSPGYVQGLASPGSPADRPSATLPDVPWRQAVSLQPPGSQQWTPHSLQLTGDPHRLQPPPGSWAAGATVTEGGDTRLVRSSPYSHPDPWPQRSSVCARACGKGLWQRPAASRHVGCGPSTPFPLPPSLLPLSLPLSFLPSYTPTEGDGTLVAWAPGPGQPVWAAVRRGSAPDALDARGGGGLAAGLGRWSEGGQGAQGLPRDPEPLWGPEECTGVGGGDEPAAEVSPGGHSLGRWRDIWPRPVQSLLLLPGWGPLTTRCGGGCAPV